MGALARSAEIADSGVPRRSRMAEQKTCFVISPIGEEGFVLGNEGLRLGRRGT